MHFKGYASIGKRDMRLLEPTHRNEVSIHRIKALEVRSLSRQWFGNK